ncbi:ubiquitin-specific protease [Trifolium repens]|nr:ubiquitin-specific protease [Trifolium repens]
MSEFLSIYAFLLLSVSPKGTRSFRLPCSSAVSQIHTLMKLSQVFSYLWYKFDHERVTKEDPKRVLEEQYGGVEELPQTNSGFNNTPFKFTKYSNAYTLVYIHEVDKEKVICNVDEKDIAVALDILKSHTRTVPGVIEAVEELDKILAFINLLISSH